MSRPRHYITAPKALETWRRAQIASIKDPSTSPGHGPITCCGITPRARWMDISIQFKAENGSICTLSFRFNNDGPLGTFFRYIGDMGTPLARCDDLFNGKDEKIDVSQVDVSMNGIELQGRELFAAVSEGRSSAFII